MASCPGGLPTSEAFMNKLSRNIAKNLVVATTIALAAFASWAFTDLRVPQVEIAAAQAE